MKVEITKQVTEDFIKLIPENSAEIQELLKLGPKYKEILMGGYLDGSVGLSCKKG